MRNTFKLFSSAAAISLALSANAGVFIGYQMDNSTADVTGWTPAKMAVSIEGDGSVLVKQNDGNNCGAFNRWGLDAFVSPDSKNNGTDNYYVSFKFRIKPGNDTNKFSATYAKTDKQAVDAEGNPKFDEQGNAIMDSVIVEKSWQQQNAQLILTSQTEEASSKKWTNTTAWNLETSPNWLFALNNITDALANPYPASDPKFLVNDSKTDTLQLNVATFYQFEAFIDTIARTVKYSICTLGEEKTVMLSGSRVIADTLNILPTGLAIRMNRSLSEFGVSDLVVGKYIDGVVPNMPFFKLAEVAYETRGFSFTCDPNTQTADEPIIHVSAEDGVSIGDFEGNASDEIEIPYSAISEGKNIVYVANSGKIFAWTTIGNLASDKKEINVECGRVTLPAPVVKMVGVNEGYSKIYQITIDNSDLPTRPLVHFSYTYAGKEVKDIASGSPITLEGAGILKVWSAEYGFDASEEVFVTNDQYFTQKTDIDFEHMTPDVMIEHGFGIDAEGKSNVSTQTWDGGMSGIQSWTGRGRIFDYILSGENDADTTIYLRPQYKVKFPARHAKGGTDCYYGKGEHEAQCGCSEDGTAGNDAENTIDFYPYKKSCSAIDSLEACSAFDYLVLPSSFTGNFNNTENGNRDGSLVILEGVGMTFNSTGQNNVPFRIQGLGEGEFVLLYTTSSYGSNSTHNKVHSIEEAKAAHHGNLREVINADGTYTFFRIDEVITRVQVMEEDASKRADLDNPQSALKDVFAPKKVVKGIFGIDGRKYNKPVKGLNIINGVKCLVK